MLKLRIMVSSIRKRGLAQTLLYVLSEYYFDLRYGVDTSSVVELDALDVVGQNRALGTPYQATNYMVLRRAFALLEESGAARDKSGAFMDFGCGKGRAMMIAMQNGYKNVIGVDFAQGLLDQCEKNLAKFTARVKAPSEWHLLHADAVSVEIPHDATLFFFYNPFGCSVMDKVLTNIDRSLSENSRSVVAIYVNPVCRDAFIGHGYREISSCLSEAILFIKF